MKTKILMVCLGNICRSPLAEGILASKLDPEKFQVDSCGTANYHVQKKPDSRSIDIAKKHGIDITNQKADQFKIEHFDKYDIIYTMDTSNHKDILKLSRNQQDKNKVFLILESLYPNSKMEVPDPYYGGEQGFEDVFKMLDKTCDTIAITLKRTTEQS